MNILGQGMSFTLDQALAGQPIGAWLSPMAQGGLHEFYGAADADGANLGALALMLCEGGGRRFRLWVRHEAQERESGTPYPAGLAELGVDPAAVLFFRAQKVISALQAGLEGANCPALGAVIIELWGEAKAYDLTASRRLALAAKETGVSVLVARTGAAPAPSAAQTRWQVRALPSRALAAKASGPPTFELTLLRARNRQEGLRYCLEWDRDARQFTPRFIAASGGSVVQPPPLSGAVVPLSFDRQGMAEPRPTGPWRRAG